MATLARAANPIRWQEITHQERNAPHWMRIGATLGPLTLLAMILYTTLSLNEITNPTREIALICIWLVHAAVAIRCLVAGANTISREHVGLTWDALVLTGVSLRRILLGKWVAAMYRVRGWLLALGVIRLAMLPVFMMAMTNRIAWRRGYAMYNYSSYADGPVWEVTWLPNAALTAVLFALLLTLLEVACCTALGMAASALTRRGISAIVLSMSIRFTPVAVFAAFTRYEQGENSWRWYRFAPFALADSGTAPLYQLVMPMFPWWQGRQLQWMAIDGLTLATLLLAALLAASLVMTWVALRHTGALPQSKQALPVARYSQA